MWNLDWDLTWNVEWDELVDWLWDDSGSVEIEILQIALARGGNWAWDLGSDTMFDKPLTQNLS